ncbi:MAG: hypothetical protein NTZ05_15150 [Chloroflexi bacterium]|nr:hypothetical protein [Chloroflexota bacterium]
MRAFAQQHSFVLAALLLLGALGFTLLGGGFPVRRIAVVVAVAAGMATFHFVMRPQPSAVASIAAVEQELRGGRPTVLEVYSDL